MDAQNEIFLFNRNVANGVSGQWSLLYVCVDEVSSNGDAVGRLYNCYQKDCYSFYGYTDLLLVANDLFDSMGMPSAQMTIRSIHPQSRVKSSQKTTMPAQYYGLPELIRHKGRCYDFCIYVCSRQNASWQGLLTLPRTQRQMFRSTLELLYLLREHQDKCAQPRREAVR